MGKNIIVANCVRINQVSFKHKINTNLFLSNILNSFIILTFSINVFNIIEICIGKIV